MWRWSVAGTVVPTGTLERPLDDSGTVDAEYAGDAFEKVLARGPFWDLLDQGQSVTIQVHPDEPAAGALEEYAREKL
jgi:hypothetical protein